MKRKTLASLAIVALALGAYALAQDEPKKTPVDIFEGWQKWEDPRDGRAFLRCSYQSPKYGEVIIFARPLRWAREEAARDAMRNPPIPAGILWPTEPKGGMH